MKMYDGGLTAMMLGLAWIVGIMTATEIACEHMGDCPICEVRGGEAACESPEEVEARLAKEQEN